MSNGSECCALLICCPPAEAQAALAKKFVECGCTQDVADKCAAYIRTEFALAPKSFETVLLEIVKMAQKHA